ncbi:hypothetical protein HK096_008588, partial [Nowakowskiella sp. JEL0078]
SLLIYVVRVKASIRALLASMNPHASGPTDASATDCCICLCGMSPYQALFLGPCSHCFHYKCVLPLLGTGIMFQCPLCRQVANLDANVTENEYEIDDAEFIYQNEAWERMAEEFQAAAVSSISAPNDNNDDTAPPAHLTPADTSIEYQNAAVAMDEEYEDEHREVTTVTKLLATNIGGATTLARPPSSSLVDIPGAHKIGIPNQQTTLGFSPMTPISLSQLATANLRMVPVGGVATNESGGSDVQHTPEVLNTAVVANPGAALDGLAQILANGDPFAPTSVLEGYAAMMEDLFDAFPNTFSMVRKESMREAVRVQRLKFEGIEKDEADICEESSGRRRRSTDRFVREDSSGVGTSDQDSSGEEIGRKEKGKVPIV